MSRRPPRKRELTEEERRLWEAAMRETRALRSRRKAHTARSAQPQPDTASAGRSGDNEGGSRHRGAPSPALSSSRAVPREPGAPAPVPVAKPLARREARRIVRNPETIDARLDLHGMRQREAYPALKGFLRAGQARGHRLVLIITGKGVAGERASREAEESWDLAPFYQAPRGVLRRLVPEWLAKPEFRDVVVSVSPAHPRHGGEGALYVRLRRLEARTSPQREGD